MTPPHRSTSTGTYPRRVMFTAAGMLALFLWACGSTPTAPLDPASLALAPGSRILAAEAETDLRDHRMAPLSRNLSVPDGVSVFSIETELSGNDLGSLVGLALEAVPADQALLFLSRKVVEKRYNPYQVFLGWRTESVVDGYENGRAVTRKREVPRFKTEYRHRCVRVRYRILQYGPGAEPMGRVDPVSSAPRACPEKSEADVVIDEFDAAARWVAERVRVLDRQVE